MTRFNVIIATHGRPTLLQRTLSLLAELDRPAGFEQVHVVENGSDAGARGVCEQIASRLPVQYHHLEKAGKNRALQLAVDKVHEGFVLFLDDDVTPTPTVLTAYADAIGRHGEAAVYGGPVIPDYEQPPPDWLVPYLPASAAGYQPKDPDRIKETGWFIGLNFGAFAQAIIRLGGFNTQLGPGAVSAGSEGSPLGDEMELQEKFYADGADAVLVTDAAVHHHVPAERCTPKWALHRLYRTEMTNVLNAVRRGEMTGTASTPRWLMRKIAAAWARAMLARLIRDPQRRFERMWDWYRWTGHRAVLHLAARWGAGSGGGS